MPRNEFSREWYQIFLDPIAPDHTEADLALIERQLPPARHPPLPDVCCGRPPRARAGGARLPGAGRGREPRSGHSCGGGSGFRRALSRLDMRALDSLPESFDVVTNLWHSFGYFDDAGNRDVLRQMAARLETPNGRLLIDVYNRDHIATLPLRETFERAGRVVHSQRSWDGPRHRVELATRAVAGDEVEFRSTIRVSWRTSALGRSARRTRLRLASRVTPAGRRARAHAVPVQEFSERHQQDQRARAHGGDTGPHGDVHVLALFTDISTGRPWPRESPRCT